MDTSAGTETQARERKGYAVMTVGAAAVAGFLVCPLVGALLFSIVDALVPHNHATDRALFSGFEGALAVGAALEPAAWLGAITGTVIALSRRLTAIVSIRICMLAAVACLIVPALYLSSSEPSHVVLLAAPAPLLCAAVLFGRSIRLAGKVPE